MSEYNQKRGKVMGYNLIYYWENFLDKYIDKEIEAKIDSFMLKFYIINQDSNETFYKWFSFSNKEELLGFIKFIALPSAYCSRAFGEKENSVLITAAVYDDVLELLENNIVGVDNEVINNFKKDYEKIEAIENKEEFDLEMIKKFCDGFGDFLDYKSKVFSNIEVYEDVKTLGTELINDFEKDGMLDELERQMNMSKEEIEEMFLNIDKNPFMLKKINTFLDSRFLL